MKKEKLRDQSIVDYLECLQIEYIMCNIRQRTYRKVKDQDFFKKTMNLKRIKIQDIAKRGNRPTIFNCKEKEMLMNFKVYGVGGFPRFAYKDAESEKELFKKDFKSYYSPGAHVSVKRGPDEHDQTDGVVVQAYIQSMTVEVKLRGESESSIFTSNHVTRTII